MTPDLFTSYPHVPGHQKTDTSEAAAKDMRSESTRLQKLVLDLLATNAITGLTSYEMAQIINLPHSTIQPRTSELKAKGQIHDSGLRRTNPASGKKTIVWKLGKDLSNA